MEIIILLFIIVIFLLFWKKNNSSKNKVHIANEIIRHRKKEYLTTENERKFFFSLRKALDNNQYIIHCQTSLIALVEPEEYTNKSKAWSRRMDFVITDSATKVLVVIELDDSSHLSQKRIKRDKYVNEALKPHHPFIRVNTEKFYDPKKIALILEEETEIISEFHSEFAGTFHR
ncbi:MAG: DUF2726 domain-containing protein [Thiomicrorhabdus sp.]|nr:DUF2726 domain-containing protein [Thiomicrorhabdus sp.]